MNEYARRQFLQDSILAGVTAVLPASSPLRALTIPAQEGRQKKQPIVEHFTGDFDGYIPLLIGNGDIGGTFDPFCGTWFDELRSVEGQREDIRSLLLARFIAQDFWEETNLDPKKQPLNEETRRSIAEGKFNVSSVTHGSPFDFYMGPADKEFPVGVQDHTSADRHRGRNPQRGVCVQRQEIPGGVLYSSPIEACSLIEYRQGEGWNSGSKRTRA